MAKTGCIYIIQNTINNKQYIGQSTNVMERWKDHYSHHKTLDYPLYQDMRKYGIKQFTFQILEDNIPISMLDKKEKEYIQKFQSNKTGYNTTSGGNHASIKKTLTKQDVKQIIEYLQQHYETKFIAELFGVTDSTISDINNGDTWHNPDLEYPIRISNYKKKNFSKSEIADIYNRLRNMETCASIGRTYNTSTTTICKINNGDIYVQPNETYPICTVKNQRPSKDKLLKIAHMLSTTTISQIQIAKRCKTSHKTVANINKGNSYTDFLKDHGYTNFPLRIMH